MEQHPVPQNVTTFQFRLIGDMTIKQFGYLAGGAILGYISLKLPLPFFFTWPLAGLFFFFGIGFAFIPVEERPMDVWVLSFLKSIYSPTQYIWSKTAKKQPLPPLAAPVPHNAVTRTPAQTSPAKSDPFVWPNIHSMNTSDAGNWFRQHLSRTPAAQPPQQGSSSNLAGHRMQEEAQGSTPMPQKVHAQAHVQPRSAAMETVVQELEKKLRAQEATAAQLREMQKQLTDLLDQKRKLEDELSLMRRKASQSRPVVTTLSPAASPTPVSPGQPTVKVLSQDSAAKAGLPRLTTFPNVITGIIKDPSGNLLPGILVTVRDKDGVPLRALKTNKLGQFAASTPLLVGTYIVEIEDPRSRYIFDRAQITVNNTLLPVIEVVAKSQKEIERAKLAQQIFGNQS